ncbi:MAG: hypothetical protein K0R54_181 [Clostridiaceae bacterium]|nr:hypothetical protein [Clostridiaceae bacterium]
MPYKSEKIKLQESQDRRRKLTEEQKLLIKEEYSKGNIGQGALAKNYGVSKSTIQIIVNPQRADRVKQRLKEHWKDYSNREELTEAVRNLRKYKQDLYLKGELKEDNEKVS